MNANVHREAILWSPESKQAIGYQVGHIEIIQYGSLIQLFSLTNITEPACQQIRLNLNIYTNLKLIMDCHMDKMQ